VTALDEFAAALGERHLDEARNEYRKIGTPLGDTNVGFLAWLAPRHQPPTA